MGLLADAFSYGNGLKRKVGGLLADPMGTLELGVTRLGEDQNKLLALMKDVLPAGRYVAPEVRKNALKELADYGSQVGMAGATVWHGSPHKFDRFDSSKIGTGEGAQAYGHGLYLAESPDVATMYRDKLTDPAFKYAAQNEAKARLNEKIAKRVEATDPQRAATLRAQVETLADPSGALYKVDLPDEHIAKMLDWDKPLSRQPQTVQGWLKDPYNAYREKLTAVDIGGAEPTGGLIMNRLQDLMSEGKRADVFSNAANFGAANASRELFDYGVPGIRYLDQGSRGTGAGTSNFVVFPGNENLLQILERNGQPVR
jgi:hypothetical protein